MNQICAEITNVTTGINEAFHDVTVLAFLIFLARVFYNTYNIFVDKSMTGMEILYRILKIILCLVRFAAVCIFASSASKAGSEFKRIMYDLDVKTDERGKLLTLLMKINDQFVEFKLLDSLKLDKNLIFAAFGSLVTYGIIIATFNVNQKQ